MRKLKLFTLAAGVAFTCLSLVNTTSAEASFTEAKKINQIDCRDAAGRLTGSGAECIQGEGYCVPNPCPDGTNQ